MAPAQSIESALIVGAGAVGQVCGWHLHRAGAEVAFVVKPKYAEETRAGLHLHQQKLAGRTDSRTFDDFEVIVDYDDIEAGRWDTIWLCVSSTAIRGNWLEELLEHVPEATVVSLQPGLEDREYMLEYVEPDRLVRGMISFIAYQSPLKGQDLDEGIAYFLPPLFPMPFSGEHAESVAKTLDQGGISSKVTDDISADSAMASTVLIPAVGGLELADWDLKAFRTGELLDLTSAATKEAQSITAAHHDTKVPLTNRTIARPWLLRCGLAAASPMLPFDLEDYLAFHFEKTSDQTRQMLRKWIELGERHGCKTDALRILVERLG